MSFTHIQKHRILLGSLREKKKKTFDLTLCGIKRPINIRRKKSVESFTLNNAGKGHSSTMSQSVFFYQENNIMGEVHKVLD